MAIRYVIWDTEDVEDVLLGVHELDASRSSGSPLALGFTSGGEYTCVVFEWVDDDTVYPVTAYPLED